MGRLIFTAITSEGGLLPSDFLQALLSPGSTIPGMEEVNYHLAEGERVTETVNRSWNRLKGCWENYQRALAKKNEGEPTTTETRDRWLLPLFQELGFGTLAAVRSLEIEGKSYPVSHGWGPVPIHLVGSHVDIDRRTPGAVGASRISPHSLVQQLLNASDDHLWGIVSNGMNLRLLRDNAALTRLAYVEWDLQAIFDADLYPEFLLLWLVCHQSRFEGEKPEACLLEQWKKAAQEKGLRALENLRPGVENAITSLGEGLVGHRWNKELRRKLSSGELSTQAFYWQILRVVYRMLFLYVAEDRELLHLPIPGNATPDEEKAHRIARERYLNYYSITRLRSLSLSRAGTPHPDLWQAFTIVCGILGSDKGSPELALPALGSFLWTENDSTPDLKECLVSNRHFLEAVHAIAFVQDGSVRRAVDYRNLGAEELGSVYESLLELHPLVNSDAGTFELRSAAGNERKTTGSYYTPDSLVQCLLDSALEPVMTDAIKGKKDQEAVEAILKLKVCDPAVGSGHFLIAAAHRMAKKVAALRTGEEEPAPAAIRIALRDVIGQCLYGVDLNPMAAELCRVNLWLEALIPGKPLAFLDHHIQVGNSLLGATPELISKGIPDEAFTAIEGDDKKACTVLKKRNKEERKTVSIEHANQAEIIHEQLQKSSVTLEAIPDESLLDIRNKEIAYRKMKGSDEHRLMKLLADTWCSAFVSRKVFQNPDDPRSAKGITQRYLDEVASGDKLLDDVIQEVRELTKQYRFFHWYLAFPEVYNKGGFDCVLGNPPWERVKFQEQEWFAGRRPDIANASNAALRRKKIAALKLEDTTLFQNFQDELREAQGESHLLRDSTLYPLCGRGDVNTYAVFAELMSFSINKQGYVGCILPSGIATDSTTSDFFFSLVKSQKLISLYDFQNIDLFKGVGHGVMHFCLATLNGSGLGSHAPIFCFHARSVSDLAEKERLFKLSAPDIIHLNPVSRTCPVFSSSKDAEVCKMIFSKYGILDTNNDDDSSRWDIVPYRMFDMTNDSNLFISTIEPQTAVTHDSERLPLFVAKMFHHFNHRFRDYMMKESDKEGHNLPDIPIEFSRDPFYSTTPPYFIPESEVRRRVCVDWQRHWFVTYRWVARSSDERTLIISVMPYGGFGNSSPILILKEHTLSSLPALVSMLSSFMVDYVVRCKHGGANLTFTTIKQIPVLSPPYFKKPVPWSQNVSIIDWVLPRFLELTYTAWDLSAFAKDYGHYSSPFVWDDVRRFLLRCELDAAFFHLYLSTTTDGQWKPARIADGAVCDGTNEELAELKRHFPTPRDVVAYIMDTFPIVRRKDEQNFNGDYRTKRVILEIYDEMAEAIKTGKSYQTRLDPPPADPRCCHPPKQIQQREG